MIKGFKLILLFSCLFTIALVSEAKPIEAKDAEVTTHLKFGITIDGKDAGFFEVGLFGKDVPKTAGIHSLSILIIL